MFIRCPTRGTVAVHPRTVAQQVLSTHDIGDQIYYDAPDYAHSYAMRGDSFPADGQFPGSDPDLMFKQLIMAAGVDIAILEPLPQKGRLPEASHAMSIAVNDWQANHWLDGHNNWHQRWRGSICVSIEAPELAAAEIERWAGHPFMSQILIKAENRPSWGDPMYDPVWAAATKHDITGQLPPRSRPRHRTSAAPSGFPELQP